MLKIVQTGTFFKLVISPYRCGSVGDKKEFEESSVLITPFEVKELMNAFCFKNDGVETTLFYLK
jgi:hypothetical protein